MAVVEQQSIRTAPAVRRHASVATLLPALARDGYALAAGVIPAATVARMQAAIDVEIGEGPRGSTPAEIRARSRTVFPHGSAEIGLACLLSEVLDIAGRVIGSPEPMCCDATLYARFAAHDVVGERETGVFHTHWDGSMLITPERAEADRVIAVNLLWFPVTRADAPMLMLPARHRAAGRDGLPDLEPEQHLLRDAELVLGEASDVLFYELGAYHKSTGFAADGRRRVTHRCIYADPAATWVCRRIPGAGHPVLGDMLRHGTSRQLAAIGVPHGRPASNRAVKSDS